MLKTEHSDHNTDAGGKQLHLAESKKNADLERTVYVLKRVVEKLQSENKRMQAGSRTCSHMKSVSYLVGYVSVRHKQWVIVVYNCV